MSDSGSDSDTPSIQNWLPGKVRRVLISDDGHMVVIGGIISFLVRLQALLKQNGLLAGTFDHLMVCDSSLALTDSSFKSKPHLIEIPLGMGISTLDMTSKHDTNNSVHLQVLSSTGEHISFPVWYDAAQNLVCFKDEVSRITAHNIVHNSKLVTQGSITSSQGTVASSIRYQVTVIIRASESKPHECCKV